MKPVQYFKDDDLAQGKKAEPKQILAYLEQFRLLQGAKTRVSPRSKLISLKVPEVLLKTFRARCELEGFKYQTQIKVLMSEWLEKL